MSSIRGRSCSGYCVTSFLAVSWLAASVFPRSTCGDVFTPITHAEYQAVYDDSLPAYPGTGYVQLTGVVINNPWDLLDYSNSASSPQWQVYIQATSAGDFGGTALFMIKNSFLGNGAAYDYDDEGWTSEMNRLNLPTGSAGELLRKGDLVTVNARAPGLHYKGKYNVNEKHVTNPWNDFDIEILDRDLIPEASLITLGDLKDSSNDFIFDWARLTGCEHYQGSLVHLDNLLLDDSAGWSLDGKVTVRQGDLTFDLKLGLDPDLDLIDDTYDLTTTPFSVTAILDQEDGSAPYADGYRLWLTNAGDFSAVPEPGTILLAAIGSVLMYPIVRKRGLLLRAR